MTEFINFFLHAETQLEWFIKTYDLWIYALLFAIIFCETGLIVTPFLPGDSLLFAVGALAGKGLIDWKIITPLLLVAAILGDGVNYAIGKWLGPKVFHYESNRFLNKAHLMKAHASTKNTVAAPSSWPVSSQSFAPSRPLWPVSAQ